MAKKKLKNKIKSKFLGGGVLFLSNISLISFGFSSWVIVTQSLFTDPIIVDVGDVIYSNKTGISDIGFTILKTSKLNFVSNTYENNGSYKKQYLDSWSFVATTSLDMTKFNSIEFSNEAFLIISFIYSGYSSTKSNIIQGLEIAPINFPQFSFAAKRSSIYNQERSGTTTNFSFPLKSKDDVCLSSLALLDSTYPKGDDYKVPLTFEFKLSYIDTSICESSFSYNVVFSLSENPVE